MNAHPFASRRIVTMGLLLALLGLVGSPVSASVFDLSADYSSVSNPSPTGWGYNDAGVFSGPIGPYGGYSTGDFSAEFGWRNPGADHLGWSQITNGGAPQSFDIQNGDVITHAATSVAWQASASTAGDYLVDLSGWTIRDLGRTTVLNLYKNDSTLLAGPFFVGDASSRAAPVSVANSLPVSLADGEYLRLTVDGADYTGVNFKLTPGLPPPPPPPANPNAYYRFEEGSGAPIVDTVSGNAHGTLIGPSIYSSDVPTPVIPRTGAANKFSMDFTQGGFGLINGHGNIFHTPASGGAAGDATLEWYMKIPQPADHAPIFWTRAEDNIDTNRFNIFWNASFTGAPDSDRFIDGDYRDPSGAAHNIGGPGYNGGDPLTINEWHHIAIVRHDLGGGQFEWNWFIDGILSPGHTSFTADPLPTSLSWLISGRQGGHSLNMLIDEIRMSDSALDPSQFLNAVPEPASIALAAMGLVGLVAAGRARRNRSR